MGQRSETSEGCSSRWKLLPLIIFLPHSTAHILQPPSAFSQHPSTEPPFPKCCLSPAAIRMQVPANLFFDYFLLFQLCLVILTSRHFPWPLNTHSHHLFLSFSLCQEKKKSRGLIIHALTEIS